MSSPPHDSTDWSTVRTSADCARRIEDLFADDLRGDAGVVHVTAAMTTAARAISVLRIGPRAPRSSTDAFVLSVARARADAILTTGRTLRAEPNTTHALGGPAAQAVELWRSEVLRKASAPLSIVLTGRADLDLDHPLLRRAARALVWTSPRNAAALAARGVPGHFEIVARPDSSLRAALPELEHERGLQTLLIEAGPHTSKALYDEPAMVDELMLSLFDEMPGDASAMDLAGELVDPARLARLFAPPSEHRSREESGAWRFLRYRRSDRAGNF